MGKMATDGIIQLRNIVSIPETFLLLKGKKTN